MRYVSILAILVLRTGSAQDCSIPFTEPLFGVQVESDVWYGNAARFDGGVDSLRLNLYKPVGDDQTERPLLLLLHGGGFYTGHRNDFNAVAQALAMRGWAAATISYRLGFYGPWLSAPPYTYDPNEFRRASYRAMQDAKGAIRFLKDRHEQDSTSTTSVFLLGGSAGAITAMLAAYTDQPTEVPQGCSAIGDVQHFLTFYPRPDLGGIDGDLNLSGHDATVMGVVNLLGAIHDTASVASAADPALFSYHQIGDPVVGCGFQRPYWNYGLGVVDNYPWMHGSCDIDARMGHLGFTPDRYQFVLHNGNQHGVHAADSVLLASLAWMRDLFCATTPVAVMEGQSGYSLVPNPAAEHVVISGPADAAANVEVFDARGRCRLRARLHGGAQAIDVRMLSPGLYVLRIDDGARSVRLRLVKE